MPSRGLFIGRFQPPHLGHLETIKHILKEKDELIIAVAAAQLSHTSKNPLTAGERLTLIRTMLTNNGVASDRYWLIPMQDILDNALWVHHVKRLVPRFDTFYGNNPFTKLLFTEAGFETKETGIVKRDLYEGTTIRKQIMNNEDVSKSLDAKVNELIQKWNIAQRLRASDTENPVKDLI